MLEAIMNYELNKNDLDVYAGPTHWYIENLCSSEIETFLQNYSDFMYRNHLRPFHSLDRYLFYDLDGSLAQLKHCFGDIDSSAVYDNYFEGVLGFDITDLMLPQNKNAAEYFFKMIDSTKYNKHANILLFFDVSANPNARRIEEYCSERRSFRILKIEHNGEVMVYGKK